MKKKFRIGQEVTLKKNYNKAMDSNTKQIWQNGGTPRFGEIYRVMLYEIHRGGSGQWFIGLNAFEGNVFNEHAFEAVVKVKTLENELETIFQFEFVK